MSQPSADPRPSIAAEQDGLPAPRRHVAIIALMLAAGMSALDVTIVALALPSLAQALQVSEPDVVWVVTAYQIGMVGALFGFAAAGEIVGLRRVFVGGIVLFGIASVACAFADNLAMLALGRVVQGFGGAAMLSMAPALLRISQPSRLLGRSFGLMATMVAVCSAIAPMVGAAIIELADWTWIFLVNIPVCALVLALASALPHRAGARRRFDWLSAILNGIAFALLIGGIDRLGEEPFAGSVCVLAALLAGALLLNRERRRDAPIVPVDLLRIPAFAAAVAGSVCLFAAQMTTFVGLPFLLQGNLGRSAVEAGLVMSAWPAAVCLAAPVGGWLADHMPAATLCGAGALAMAVALAALSLWPGGFPMLPAIVLLALSGVGFAFYQTSNNRSMLLAAPRARGGAAGGSLATARQFGQALGAVIVALCLAVSTASGPRAALFLGALLALAAATIGWRRPVSQN